VLRQPHALAEALYAFANLHTRESRL
jgi:hypothetical protein